MNGWEFEATDIAQSKFRMKKDQEYVLVIKFSLDGGIRDVRWEDSNLLVAYGIYSLIKTNDRMTFENFLAGSSLFLFR